MSNAIRVKLGASLPVPAACKVSMEKSFGLIDRGESKEPPPEAFAIDEQCVPGGGTGSTGRVAINSILVLPSPNWGTQ